MATSTDAFMQTYIDLTQSENYNAGVQSCIEAYIRNGRVVVAYADAANRFSAFPSSTGFTDWKNGYNHVAGLISG